MKQEDVSNAYFNITDLSKTISSHGLRNIKRVHGGTDNEDTIGDLVDDLEYFITQLVEDELEKEYKKDEIPTQ